MYDLLLDKKSKESYVAVLYFRLTGEIKYLNKVFSSQSIYFEVYNNLTSDEIVFDCESYTGDTLREYPANNHVPRKYVIFEPNKNNIKELKNTIKLLCAEKYTILVEKGVGNSDIVKYIKVDNGSRHN